MLNKPDTFAESFYHLDDLILTLRRMPRRKTKNKKQKI